MKMTRNIRVSLTGQTRTEIDIKRVKDLVGIMKMSPASWPLILLFAVLSLLED